MEYSPEISYTKLLKINLPWINSSTLVINNETKKHHQSHTNILQGKGGNKQEKYLTNEEYSKKRSSIVAEKLGPNYLPEILEVQSSNISYEERGWKRYLKTQGRDHKTIGRDKI